ncbi:hypothetical protein [Paenibacillus alba]|uniref:Uncharacterized protein n=1 Tax=Paenibacillus alba TaxID=1197127 RepID=A0ABU6G9V6_9BACL|nr:hypothetical protein [Paenibacillus alba]MEC0230380.1 hypothetical protein [Paenibacillus alba]
MYGHARVGKGETRHEIRGMEFEGQDEAGQAENAGHAGRAEHGSGF